MGIVQASQRQQAMGVRLLFTDVVLSHLVFIIQPQLSYLQQTEIDT